MEQYVCSYCGARTISEGRSSGGQVLNCGHDDTGDWDRGTHEQGAGRPIPASEFKGPTEEQHQIERRRRKDDKDAWVK